MDVALNASRAATTLRFCAKSPERPSLWIMSARAMVAFASALMWSWRANAAAIPLGPTTWPDESEAQERFDAATAAEPVARPVLMTAAPEERLDAPAFLSVASCRICAISPLTAGVTLRHHEMPLSLPERCPKT